MTALLTATTPMLACKDTLSEKLSGKFFFLQKGRGSSGVGSWHEGARMTRWRASKVVRLLLRAVQENGKKSCGTGPLFSGTPSSFALRAGMRWAGGAVAIRSKIRWRRLSESSGTRGRLGQKSCEAWIHPSRSNRTLQRLTVVECMSGLSAMTSLLLPLAASRRILLPLAAYRP